MSNSVHSDLPPFPGTTREMSLRDYYAGCALPALIGTAESMKGSPWGPVTVSEIAEKAFQYADAMIAARSRR